VTDDNTQNYLDSLGLVRSGPYFAYTPYGAGWFLPSWVLAATTWLWNSLACQRYGHECLGLAEFEGEVIEDWHCFHCHRRDCRE